jgi:hypothetical protein
MVEDAQNFAYLTDCGCWPGGICPSDCDDISGIGIPQYDIPIDQYCINAAVECPSQEIPGCTDPNAENYNPDATIDDGTCEYVGTPSIQPNINNRWILAFTGGIIVDPTPGNQIDNFDNQLHSGIYDTSNIFYLELKHNDELVTSTDSMVFAFINDELRGFTKIKDIIPNMYYGYLEVKWKQQLEEGDEILFYAMHDSNIYFIDSIKTYTNINIPQVFTTNALYL